MLVTLSEEQRRHLALLPQVDQAVVAEFGRIALEFLRRGASPKIYEGAARKLCVAVETVQRGVEALMFLMAESAKHMVSGEDFLDSLCVLGLSDNLNQTLLQLYLQHLPGLCFILQQLSVSPPSYCDLNWRLEVQLSSRSLHHWLSSSTLTLVLRSSTSDLVQQDVVLQADISTLLHLLSRLEVALQAGRSGRARRFARSLK